MEQFRHGPFNDNERTIIEDFIKKHIEENIDIYMPKLRKRSRRVLERPNYSESVWGRMLRDPNVKIERSSVSRKFRRRFRVPFVLYQDVILPQCIVANVFEMKYNSTIPVEFRVF